MKAFAGLMVLSLAVSTMAQQVTPPAVPNVGVAAGATGGVGTPATGIRTPGTAVVPIVPGRPTFAPPPVLMTPEQIQAPYVDPLLPPGLLPLVPYVELPPEPAPVVGQGRPGGLGVTITGGSSSPPPPVVAASPTNVTIVITNPAAVATNPPPTNATSGNPTNVPPQLPY